MPFDLSTAKPAADTSVGGGFDIGTATPIKPAAAAPRQPFDRAAALKQNAEAAKQRKVDTLREFGTDFFKSAGDTAASLVSNAITTPIAGVTGLVSAPFVGGERAAGIIRSVQDIGYKPQSMAGQQTAQVMGNVLDKANRPGEYIAEKTGSPALGALVTTTLQGGAAMLDPAVRGAFRSVGGSAVRAATRAPKPAPAAPAGPSAQATQAAQSYASSNGLDWASLSDGVRTRLAQIAQTSGDFSGLDPAAIRRQAQFESMPVPVPTTRGVLEQSEPAMRNEVNASSTRAGIPVKKRMEATNSALLANLDVLKGKVSGAGATAAKATSPEEAGAAVQGAARGKQAQIKSQVNDLYTKARETEPNATVSLQPVTDLLTSNPEIQHLGWVQSWLNKGAKAKRAAGLKEDPTLQIAKDAMDGPVAMTDAKLSELHDLRSQASAIRGTGGKEGYYAGEVVKAIDGAMQSVPEGAKAWKAANAAHKAERIEFDDQGAVSDLVSNASRTDRTTALSNTVKAVTSGAPEEIRQIKRTLLTGGDEASRTAGRQAWREVRSQVIDQIKEDATKGLARTETGEPILTPGALNAAIKKYGPQKLDEIFGPGTTRQLYDILDVTKLAKVIPDAGGANVGSSTVRNALAFLEKGLTATVSKVPGIGRAVAGGIDAGIERFAAGAAAKKATTTPLNEIADRAARSTSRAATRTKLKEAARTTAPSSESAQGSRK